jgi:hypothetical protein
LNSLELVNSLRRVDVPTIKSALADISTEADPTIKSLKLASLCSALWKERGIQLVVVGGSAIEILTEGAYTSGDLDFCHVTPVTLPMRERQAVMGLLQAQGGPRNWLVAGMYVDLLGPAESAARTPYRRVQGPYGEVWLMKPEDLLVERVLVSRYPQDDPAALDCAKKFTSVILGGGVSVDWAEVRRIASLPEYGNLSECTEIVTAIANELKVQNPLHPD